MAFLTFKGGVHPYDGKELSKDKPITDYLPKQELVYPLSPVSYTHLLEVREAYAGRMQGLALKNVRFTVKDGKKVLYDESVSYTHLDTYERST